MMRSTHTRSRQGEEWEVIHRVVSDGKREKRTSDHFARTFPEDRIVPEECAKQFRLHSRASLVHVHVRKKSGKLFIDPWQSKYSEVHVNLV